METVVRNVTVSIVILGMVLFIVAYLTWLERKFAGRMQSRIGPYWVGRPHGWLQPVADGIKLLVKEDIIPKKADKWIFNAAPIVVLLTALLLYAVIPFAPNFILQDLNIGVLYLLAVSSLTVLGVFMAGWGSNNKYALLSAMRMVSQLVAYEIPLVLAALLPCLLAGSLNLGEIVSAQKNSWFIVYPGVGQVAFLIFMLAFLAEGNRIPFDIPEAESELVAGYTVEYSGMKFAFFYLGEYAHLLAVSFLISALFLGGWYGIPLPPFLSLFLKTLLVFILVLLIRWSYIRLRVDQLLAFNWKILVPLSLVNLVFAGFLVS